MITDFPQKVAPILQKIIRKLGYHVIAQLTQSKSPTITNIQASRITITTVFVFVISAVELS